MFVEGALEPPEPVLGRFSVMKGRVEDCYWLEIYRRVMHTFLPLPGVAPLGVGRRQPISPAPSGFRVVGR